METNCYNAKENNIKMLGFALILQQLALFLQGKT